MCAPALPVIMGAASVGMSVVGSIQANNARRRAAQDQNAQLAWQRKEQLRVATERWQQNVLNVQQSYLNQVRERDWRYHIDTGNWRVTSQRQKFNEDLKEFDFQGQELERKAKNDNLLADLEQREILEERDYTTFLFQDRAQHRRGKFQFELDKTSRQFSREDRNLDQYIEGVREKGRVDAHNW